MAFWNEKIETMPVDELKELQLELLKKQIDNVYRNSPFYRKRMDDAGVRPEDIRTLDDIRNCRS